MHFCRNDCTLFFWKISDTDKHHECKITRIYWEPHFECQGRRALTSRDRRYAQDWLLAMTGTPGYMSVSCCPFFLNTRSSSTDWSSAEYHRLSNIKIAKSQLALDLHHLSGAICLSALYIRFAEYQESLGLDCICTTLYTNIPQGFLGMDGSTIHESSPAWRDKVNQTTIQNSKLYTQARNSVVFLGCWMERRGERRRTRHCRTILCLRLNTP